MKVARPSDPFFVKQKRLTLIVRTGCKWATEFSRKSDWSIRKVVIMFGLRTKDRIARRCRF